ncbi:MAG: hypothetical protein DHS20C09_18340 [marine bacterium B5-7]|nr:MAG: hypothetical protein DHS20C09_18340 [marine bacterium B5-7]
MEKRYKHFDHKEHTLIHWWRKEQLRLREMGRRLRSSNPWGQAEVARN